MKRFLLSLCLVAMCASCGEDNSSTVGFTLDANGCFVDATDFDSSSSSVADKGFRTQVFVWECADYTNPGEKIDVKEKKVSLIFTGVECLELTATLIEEGFCLEGKTPVL